MPVEVYIGAACFIAGCIAVGAGSAWFVARWGKGGLERGYDRRRQQ